VLCKSDSEVRDLLRAVKKLAYQPARRRPGSSRLKKVTAVRNAL
jgi:hypothetical protein